MTRALRRLVARRHGIPLHASGGLHERVVTLEQEHDALVKVLVDRGFLVKATDDTYAPAPVQRTSLRANAMLAALLIAGPGVVIGLLVYGFLR